MRARFYNISTRRFLTRDPFIEENIASGRNLNRYVFVDGRVLTEIDPLGLYGIRDFGDDAKLVGKKVFDFGIGDAISACTSDWKSFDCVSESAMVFVKPAKAGKVIYKAAKTVNNSPDFIVTPKGVVYPVPKGATGPTPVVNGAGKQTGYAFTGGAGGVNGQVTTMRIMNATQPKGSIPGYQNGYIKYENSAIPKPQGVDPYTGKTLSNSESHFPIE